MIGPFGNGGRGVGGDDEVRLGPVLEGRAVPRLLAQVQPDLPVLKAHHHAGRRGRLGGLSLDTIVAGIGEGHGGQARGEGHGTDGSDYGHRAL
ncbi:hypothetical protein ACWEFD_35065 [Streptomyces ardesiacus]